MRERSAFGVRRLACGRDALPRDPASHVHEAKNSRSLEFKKWIGWRLSCFDNVLLGRATEDRAGARPAERRTPNAER